MSAGTTLIIERRACRTTDAIDLAPPDGIIVVDAKPWLAPHLGAPGTRAARTDGTLLHVAATRRGAGWSVSLVGPTMLRELTANLTDVDVVATVIDVAGWRWSRARARRRWLRLVSDYLNERLWSARTTDQWNPGSIPEWSGGHPTAEEAATAARIGFQHDWDAAYVIDEKGRVHHLDVTRKNSRKENQ